MMLKKEGGRKKEDDVAKRESGFSSRSGIYLRKDWGGGGLRAEGGRGDWIKFLLQDPQERNGILFVGIIILT